jgi:small subunit ribosomal protein S8
MTNDPISDMLTRIRNAVQAKNDTVIVLNTKTNAAISVILKREGFIRSVKQSRLNPIVLQLTLKYKQRKKACISHIQRYSRPSLRHYTNYKNIPEVLDGLGLVIVSTSRGVMTGRQARTNKIGGEILCSLW